MFVAVAKMSWCTTPNEPRNTIFGWKFQARPSRGAKLLRSLLANGPLLWTIAPVSPLTGSFAVGSNCACWPYFVWNGVSYDQRTPKFTVTPLNGFQSSCTYHWCDHHRGSQLANSCVNVALDTVPSRNEANPLPVFGVKGASVPPNV